jgi:response regulator RpfG family c-di-GMP phosphodiesterase
LCVDDEPNVLEGLTLTLRRGYEVVAAAGGEAGLDILGRDSTIAAIVSDMRMPGMDGAAFLSKARLIAPDATRMLLTGQTDMDAAIAAINEGRIFRFLTKPCPPAALVKAVETAVEQYRLVTAERVLLRQTLRGCIQMLTDVLALAAPIAFGQAIRIRRYAGQLAAKVAGAEAWPIEVCALLSQIGYVSLAPATVEKLYEGKPLTGEEQQSVDRLPAVAEQLIAGIPRLDEVRGALKWQTQTFDGSNGKLNGPRGKDIPLGARILRIVADFDRLEGSGLSAPVALDMMRRRSGRYDPELLELFASTASEAATVASALEIPIRLVRAGMTFIEDVRTPTGALLVARGHEATTSLVERIRNLAPGAVREPVRVVLRRGSQKEADVESPCKDWVV